MCSILQKSMALVGVSLALIVAVAKAHTWTDASGKHTIEAEFVSLSSGSVTLKKTDGETISLPLEKLSSVDQEFAKSTATKADSDNPFVLLKNGQPADQTPIKGACRVLLTISETGDCTFQVAPLYQQADSETSGEPEPKIIKHDDGTIEYRHRFASKEAVDAALSNNPQNVEFDSNSKTLSLKQRKKDDGKYERAIFTYSKFIRFPLTVELDVKNLDQGTLAFGLSSTSSKDGTRHPDFHVVSKDKLETATLLSQWVSGRKPDGTAIVELILKDQTFKVANSTPCHFRLPVPNAPINDMFLLNIADVWGVNPIEFSGMSIRTKFAPMFGLSLDKQDDMIFAKHVFGLAQRAGVQEGDVLVSVNGHQPSSMEEAVEIMRKIEMGDMCTLVLKRGDKQVTIPIKAE